MGKVPIAFDGSYTVDKKKKARHFYCNNRCKVYFCVNVDKNQKGFCRSLQEDQLFDEDNENANSEDIMQMDLPNEIYYALKNFKIISDDEFNRFA